MEKGTQCRARSVTFCRVPQCNDRKDPENLRSHGCDLKLSRHQMARAVSWLAGNGQYPQLDHYQHPDSGFQSTQLD